MSARLILSLPPGRGADASNTIVRAPWSVIDSDGVVLAEGLIAPGEAPRWPEGLTVASAVALLPSQDVLVRHRRVPGRNDREIRRAAPYQIEEILAAALDDTEIATGAPDAAGRRWILAVRRDVHQLWRSYLTGLGIKPVHAVPDALLLSGHGGDLTLAAVDGVILFQTRAGDLLRQAESGESDDEPDPRDPVCGAVDAVLAEAVLPALGRQIQPRRLLISPDIDPAIIASDDRPIAVKRQPAPDLRVTAAQASEKALASLPALFGEALGSGIDWAMTLQPWRRAAVLAALLPLLATGLLVAEGVHNTQRAAYFDAASDGLFRAEFPQVTRVVNAQAQLQEQIRALGGAEGDNEFLRLSAALAEAVAQSDAIRIDSVRYDAQRGGLSVTAAYLDFADFERFREAARTQGLVVEDGGARQVEQGFTGEFVVRLP